MFEFIYVENAVREHPRTLKVLSRFPGATLIPCERYGEVFNPRAQNFRLQKKRPALILAQKHGDPVLDAPPHYGIGGSRSYYFSHMLNCIYDCRYCFLQGMYQSAHLVLFVNYQDFQAAIHRKIEEAGGEECCFFSGYDCDSLALDPLSGFTASFLPFFGDHPEACLELRTKSVQIKELLRHPPLSNVVVAFSFTPAATSEALEHGVPSIDRRLDAMERLQDAGWPLGLRFDPLVYHEGYEEEYRRLFARVFSRLRASSIHSVSLGPFRLPRAMYKTIHRLYPEEVVLSVGLEERNGLVSYREDHARKLGEFARSELLRYVSGELLYQC